MGKFSIRRGLTVLTTAVYILAGSHGIVRAEGSEECSDVEYKREFNVNEEYLNAFKKLVNNELNGHLTNADANAAYMALYTFICDSNYTAGIKRLNKQQITIEDFNDFSVYCENETDRQIIHEMILMDANLYIQTFSDVSAINIENIDKFLIPFDDVMAFIQNKKSALTLGGIWLIKNGGYPLLDEHITLYVEYQLQDSRFARVWWTWFDKDIYDTQNIFVLRENVTREVINNSDCNAGIMALADHYLELQNRIRNVNKEIPELIPCTEEYTVYGGNRIMLVGNSEDSDTYRTMVTTDAMGNVVEIKGKRRA